VATSEVTVLLFGPLRERVGAGELRLTGGTVREVWQALVKAHPGGSAAGDSIRAARNLHYCEWDETLEPGDTLAFIPPVAGGSGHDPVRAAITTSTIDIAEVIGTVGSAGDGAIASFIGTVRDNSEGFGVERIDYEAYTDMAEAEMRRIGGILYARGGITTISMVHRIGSVAVGDVCVVVAVAAPHRDAAFAACEESIAMIKRTLPVWKREHREDGARWVDARLDSKETR